MRKLCVYGANELFANTPVAGQAVTSGPEERYSSSSAVFRACETFPRRPGSSR